MSSCLQIFLMKTGLISASPWTGTVGLTAFVFREIVTAFAAPLNDLRVEPLQFLYELFGLHMNKIGHLCPIVNR